MDTLTAKHLSGKSPLRVIELSQSSIGSLILNLFFFAFAIDSPSKRFHLPAAKVI